MTPGDMQRALLTGFNHQGRTVSDSMRANYLAEIADAKPALRKEEYRGFAIEGRSSKWFVATFPIIFHSHRAAREAVDRCLALRAELAKEQP